jgi:hypothetical protein
MTPWRMNTLLLSKDMENRVHSGPENRGDRSSRLSLLIRSSCLIWRVPVSIGPNYPSLRVRRHRDKVKGMSGKDALPAPACLYPLPNRLLRKRETMLYEEGWACRLFPI